MKKLTIVLFLFALSFNAFGQTADTLKGSVTSHVQDSISVVGIKTTRAVIGSSTGTARLTSGVISASASDTVGMAASIFGKLDKTHFLDSLNAHGGVSSARTVPAYTASTTMFLRADSSWQTPPGAGLADTATASYWATRLRGVTTGTVRASSGTLLATASDTVGLAAALAAKVGTSSVAFFDTTGRGAIGAKNALTLNATRDTIKMSQLVFFDSTGRGAAGTRNHLTLNATRDTVRVTASDTVGLGTSFALYETKTQMGTDTTTQRTYSNSLYAVKSDAAFSGTFTLPTGFSGTVRAASGVVSATASDTVGLAAALAAKITGTRSTIQTKGDTLALFVVGLGTGAASDTSAFVAGAYCGSFFNDGTDSLHVTKLMSVMNHGIGTDTCNVDVQWHSTHGSGSATHLVTNGSPVNSITTGNSVTSFTNFVIPPGVWVWATTNTVTTGRKPTYLRSTISGYRTKP